jgi:hypothetical protein
VSNKDKAEIIMDKISLVGDNIEKHIGVIDDDSALTEELATLILPEITSALAKLEKYLEDNC